MRDTSAAFPFRILITIAVSFFTMAALNYAFTALGLIHGTPAFFPISIFSPRFRSTDLPYAVSFLTLSGLLLRRSDRFSVVQVWALGTGLIVLGNLIQGGFEEAFFKPFHVSRDQYYFDAIRVMNWRTWLREFNDIQAGLSTHSRTHPPFAVLLHHLFLRNWVTSIPWLAAGFIAISSLAIPLLWHTLKASSAPAVRCSELALLFAVLPAANVYGAVTLDGVILSCFSLALYGLVRMSSRAPDLVGPGFVLVGILLSNALTFAGLFLFLLMGLLALRQIALKRNYYIFKVLCLCLVIGAALCAALSYLYGYDHLTAFRTASRLENPNGFRALHRPLEYVATRIEDVAEVALFLSFGVLALLIQRTRLLLGRLRDHVDDVVALVAAALVAWGLMLVTGAYRTGETARACLYLYPYFILALRDVSARSLRLATLVAALQTAAMQLLGYYVW